MQDRIAGINYSYIRKKLDIRPGDIVYVNRYSENGRFETKRRATVREVYQRYALLDFGCYLECVQLVDLFINDRLMYRITRVHAN